MGKEVQGWPRVQEWPALPDIGSGMKKQRCNAVVVVIGMLGTFRNCGLNTSSAPDYLVCLSAGKFRCAMPA
jgi:hypothetical protein